MSKPYTHEEYDALSLKQHIELAQIKSRLIPPYCFIGQPLSEAREKMADWKEHYGHHRDSVVIHDVAGNCGFFGDMRIQHWYCTTDENNIITDLWNAQELRDIEQYKKP
jgi:hypothetical protein